MLLTHFHLVNIVFPQGLKYHQNSKKESRGKKRRKELRRIKGGRNKGGLYFFCLYSLFKSRPDSALNPKLTIKPGGWAGTDPALIQITPCAPRVASARSTALGTQ